MSRIGWALILIAAGSAAVVLCRVTAPACAARDLFDSPLLWPAYLALVALSGVAGWFRPRGWPLWGLLVMLPFFVMLVGSVVVRGDGQGLWLVGLVFLVLMTVVPVASALVTSRVAGRRAAAARRE
jgi:hypothetical protein